MNNTMRRRSCVYIWIVVEVLDRMLDETAETILQFTACEAETVDVFKLDFLLLLRGVDVITSDKKRTD